MTEHDNTAPAVWDPTARGGVGGWVRPGAAQQPRAESQPTPGQPFVKQPPAQPAHDDQHTSIFPLASPQSYQQAPAAPPQQTPHQPPHAQPPQQPAPHHQQQHSGPTGPDQGPPLAARPYLPPPGPAGPPPPPFGGPPAPSSGYGFPPPPPGGGFPGQNTPPGTPPTGGFPNSGFPGANTPPPPNPFPSYQQQPPQRQFADYEELPYEEPRRRAPLLVAIGVVLVVVVGVGAVWAIRNTDEPPAKPSVTPSTSAANSAAPQPAPDLSSPAAAAPSEANSPSPSASSENGPKAAEQAKALDQLLARGEGAKAPIGNAVAKVNSCPAKPEIDNAVTVFETGAAQRDKLVADLAKLQFGDLPAGAEAVEQLRTAWQTSGDIDRAYAAWARTVSSQGCSNGTAPGTADLKRANELNPQATQAKKDFVAKWNSLAHTFSLTPRTWDRI